MAQGAAERIEYGRLRELREGAPTRNDHRQEPAQEVVVDNGQVEVGHPLPQAGHAREVGGHLRAIQAQGGGRIIAGGLDQQGFEFRGIVEGTIVDLEGQVLEAQGAPLHGAPEAPWDTPSKMPARASGTCPSKDG